VVSNLGFFRVPGQSRTIPTGCRYCGAKVFFHTNESGSKVVFDELGAPWPKHSCPGYENSLKSSNGPVGRFIHTETGDLVHADAYLKNIQSGHSTRKKWDQPIVAVHPVEGLSIYEIGVVRDIIPGVDIYKRFDLKKETRFCRQLLGDIGEKKHAQVTMYADDITTGKLASYTFFILQTTWNDLRAVKDDLLHFKVEGKSVPGHTAYWMCTNIGYEM